MIGSCAAFAAATGLIRHVGSEINPFEVVFFRNLFGLLVFVPWFLRRRVALHRPRRINLYLARAFVGIFTMTSWFYAVTLIPLAEATALSFTSPLFATVAAVVMLHEIVRFRRWSATLVGFFGAMVILRPSAGMVDLPAVLVLVSAASLSVSIVLIKLLSRTESAEATVTYHTVLLLPVSLIPALFVWQWPTAEQLLWLLALGAFAQLGTFLIARALALADASAIMPYDFIRLPFTALVGFVAFAEVPDMWTWVGAAIIFASSFYIARREAQLRRAGASGVGARAVGLET